MEKKEISVNYCTGYIKFTFEGIKFEANIASGGIELHSEELGGCVFDKQYFQFILKSLAKSIIENNRS